MKTDIDLDMWVAENVFKCYWISKNRQRLQWNKDDRVVCIPHYTSDMNEAIKVLRYFHGTLSHDSVEWNVGTVFDLEKFVAYHAKPAKAICLAAYKLETGEDWNNK